MVRTSDEAELWFNPVHTKTLESHPTVPWDWDALKWAQIKCFQIWNFGLVSHLKMFVYRFDQVSTITSLFWSTWPTYDQSTAFTLTITSPPHFFPPMNCHSPTLALILPICTPKINFDENITYKTIKLWSRISKGYCDMIRLFFCSTLIYNETFPSLLTPLLASISLD